MSWLSSFWDHNRNFLGNALKNVAPAAFLIPGAGPGIAALIGGAGSALGRGIQKGAAIGDILKQGAQGAGIAYTGAGLTGGKGEALKNLRGLFTGGGKAAAADAGGDTVTMALPSAGQSSGGALASGPSGVGVTPVARSAAQAMGGSPALGGSMPGVAPFTPSSVTLSAPQVATIPGKSLSLAARAGAFAKEYPAAAAMGLQGLGTLSTMPATYAANKREQTLFDEQMSERERRRQALAPLYKMMLEASQNAFKPQASTGPNPWATYTH